MLFFFAASTTLRAPMWCTCSKVAPRVSVSFAVEDMPEPLLLGATIQIGDERFGHQQIRDLYFSEAFPLKRAKQAA